MEENNFRLFKRKIAAHGFDSVHVSSIGTFITKWFQSPVPGTEITFNLNMIEYTTKGNHN